MHCFQPQLFPTSASSLMTHLALVSPPGIPDIYSLIHIEIRILKTPKPDAHSGLPPRYLSPQACASLTFTAMLFSSDLCPHHLHTCGRSTLFLPHPHSARVTVRLPAPAVTWAQFSVHHLVELASKGAWAAVRLLKQTTGCGLIHLLSHRRCGSIKIHKLPSA